MEYKNYSTQVLVKSANDDNLTIDAVISTSEVDRDGESVRQSGIKADVFMENPIVLRQHQRDAIPIGRVVNLKTEDTTTTRQSNSLKLILMGRCSTNFIRRVHSPLGVLVSKP